MQPFALFPKNNLVDGVDSPTGKQATEGGFANLTTGPNGVRISKLHEMRRIAFEQEHEFVRKITEHQQNVKLGAGPPA